MTYTGLAVLFLLVCVGVGCLRGGRFAKGRLAAVLAALMVAAQFAVLMLK
jgi:hypothetical protein